MLSKPSTIIPPQYNPKSIHVKDIDTLANTYMSIYNRLYELINQLYH